MSLARWAVLSCILLSSPASAEPSDVDVLKQQVKSLEQRLEQLEKGSQTPTAPVSKGSPDPAPETSKPAPFAFADFTWLNGNSRTHSSPLDTKYFTGELRVDTNY